MKIPVASFMSADTAAALLAEIGRTIVGERRR